MTNIFDHLGQVVNREIGFSLEIPGLHRFGCTGPPIPSCGNEGRNGPLGIIELSGAGVDDARLVQLASGRVDRDSQLLGAGEARPPGHHPRGPPPGSARRTRHVHRLAQVETSILEQVDHLRRAHRLGEGEALAELAVEPLEHVELVARFDALGDHP